MTRKKKKQFQKIILSLVAAALFTWITQVGILDTANGVVSDGLYQRAKATDGTIVVIGIDQRAIESLGPLPWSRNVMAEAIRFLNSDENTKPAVIGIDMLFVGDSGDPEADESLASAAEEGGNVVVASSATFGSQLVDEGESFYMQEDSIVAWDEPYEALLAGAGTGHINAMADEDGIMRHALLKVDVPDRGEVPSFSRILYERFCKATGESVNPAPATQKDFFYIPFTTKEGGYYDDISIVDLIDQTISPSFFADKIVLIGPYAAGLQDEYRTSIDHAAPMYGVEIQANIIDAFRRGAFPKEVSRGLELAILFAASGLLCYFFLEQSMRISIVMEIIVCAAWLLVCIVCYSLGFLFSALPVPLFTTILFVTSTGINYINSQRERRRVTNTFGHYVDPAVMNNLLEQGSEALELGGKTYDIAVLFVDIRGFTTMSESLDPPTVVEIINQYLTLTTECILKNHGILDKFVGDCTMAFWNAPFPQDDAVYLACCAAMDMVEGSIALGEKLLERFGRTVSFGVGVNFGPAVVGNIGAPLRMDYTAIGDTVNTAARLEANAPGGKILISRAVADILGDRASVTSLGDTIQLKGKAKGFEILTLDSLVR
ncbi:MAG: adenylate/guanylate cyclase domain-containing protein [Lachnospiraceae bacterium]|nr:adenylate/guanylate cyclase domain-containing protein [Lachnospiraceae bacterium]